MGMVLPTGHLNAPLEPGARLLFILLLHSLLSLSLYIYLMDMHSIPSTQLKFLSCHLYLFTLPRNRFLAALLSAIHTHTTSPLFFFLDTNVVNALLLVIAGFLINTHEFSLYSTLLSDYIRPEIFHHSHSNCVIVFFSPKKENALHENSLVLHQVSLSSSYISLSNSSMLYTIAAIAAAAAILVLGF